MAIKLDVFIPTLNRADLLFESLDNLENQQDQINNLHILDNGNQDIIPIPYSGKHHVQQAIRNYGVAESWNMGLYSAFMINDATHLMVLGDDIVLFPNQIKEIKQMLNANDVYFQFFWGPFTWSVWAMGKRLYLYLYNKYGWVFDPGFFPAYCEDNDFHRRLDLDGINYLADQPVMKPEVCRNSMTAKFNPTITHNRGLEYYKLKWGGAPGKEKWDIPFNEK